jgi:hypothetical protein
MAKLDPQVLAHLEWLGFVRPTGLVVSAAALVRAGAILDQRDAEGQRLLRASLRSDGTALAGKRAAPARGTGQDDEEPQIAEFGTFAGSVLGWRFSPNGYAGTPESPIPPELEVVLPDFGLTLRPDFAVRELEAQDGTPAWQLLVRVINPGEAFDREGGGGSRSELSPHSQMERLLRQTGVPAGLLVNGAVLRLISAPRGESSGWLDFRVAEMVETAGRPICSAMRLLLSEQRLLALPRHQRLAALLADSRKFQNEVSEKLAEQVLHALYELLRGFQAAHGASKGELLKQALAEHPDQVYRGLLTVILRLVFLLYAEERDMLPAGDTFLRYYSLAGLHERLREDAALYPDTLDQRFGAWAQLVALFRMVHDGAEAPGVRLPARHGVLFDPDRFPFLEGRSTAGARQIHERIEPPLVPDGTVYRALEDLLVLDGERISYRALDVEQIGSVYETMMGFRLETASGRSVAIRSQKKQGAPTAVDLEALLAKPGANRGQALQDQADRKLTEAVKHAVAAATNLEDLHAALLPVIDQSATPDLVPKGAMVLQPSEERRRSGSHYTPRELTEPIVRTTLEPIFLRLSEADGKPPRPEAILDLKVCDPAMGSGAFLVETCRHLGDALVEAWRAHGLRPEIPPDEDEVVFARRLIAQRCLYGVDRNPVAVDLSKMSLWLVTLARDHALTFVDHALRHGDSLVGLSRRQLAAFHWAPDAPRFQAGFEAVRAVEHLGKVSELRSQIRGAVDTLSDWKLRDLWDKAQYELAKVRLLGDLAVAAFFEADQPKRRELRRREFANTVVGGDAERYHGWLEEMRQGDPPLVPFHWEIEFPEVFHRDKPGFDAFVGNPPFAGKNSVASGNVVGYPDWLKEIHEASHGNADLVAHFFRRAFTLLRDNGVLGLIATNTIAQGDTRSTGLRWICTHGGEVFAVRRRAKWPGMAAVVVSIVHLTKGRYKGRKHIDDREVENISAFLFHRGGHDDPARLAANAGRSFQGSIVLGLGFTFDDTNTKGVATAISEMQRLLAEEPECREVIFPYIGGEEVNTSPTHAHYRYVINFRDWSEKEASRYKACWRIVVTKVKPERQRKDRSGKFILRDPLPQRYWQYAEKRPGLYAAVAGLERVLTITQTSRTVAFTFLPIGMVYSHKLVVFPFDKCAALCALQARPHELWARFFGSTMKDDAVYTPSDCFETFPFPQDWEKHPALEAAGKAYFEFRAGLMVRNSEGLTKTYNRFHDPDERHADILKLRELHSDMDRAVLEAYGWGDISTECEFLLDYQVDEGEWGDKKKPWRYRWPNEIRDEVLARLLELNAERAAAEVRSGAMTVKKRSRKRGGTAPQPASHDRDLFS